MTWTVSYLVSQGVVTDGPADELMTAGMVGGDQPPPTPEIEALWISTFNLRWWDHLVVDRQAGSPPAENVARGSRSRLTA